MVKHEMVRLDIFTLSSFSFSFILTIVPLPIGGWNCNQMLFIGMVFKCMYIRSLEMPPK